MNTTRNAYRGKYPNNIRAVWSGKDRIIHIETMSGDHFTCTGEQARYVNPRNLPNPGTDSTPYRNAAAMPIVSVTVSTPAVSDVRPSIPVLLTPLRGTQAFRMAAIRRFLRDATPGCDDDWISQCIDNLQRDIGSIEGRNVAAACGFTNL